MHSTAIAPLTIFLQDINDAEKNEPDGGETRRYLRDGKRQRNKRRGGKNRKRKRDRRKRNEYLDYYGSGGDAMESGGMPNDIHFRNGELGTSSTRINGQLGTSNFFPGQGNNGNIQILPPPPFTSSQLPYCPNYSMQSTGMGPCMALQTPIPGIDACPSGTLGWYSGGQCVVW